MENLSLNLKIAKEKIKYNEKMCKHTTFKIGGPAEYFILISNIEELKEVLNFAKQEKVPITIIGNGSNILVSDKGIKGITLNIKIEKIEIKEKDDKIQITVGAGETLAKLAQICLKNQIAGIEELSGIPGTIRWSNKNECWSSWKRNKRHIKKCKMFRL